MFGKPVALFAGDYDFGAGTSIANYDVAADGRFIMIRRGVNGGKLQNRHQLDGRVEADLRIGWRAMNPRQYQSRCLTCANS